MPAIFTRHSADVNAAFRNEADDAKAGGARDVERSLHDVERSLHDVA
jgi:hypothetical protein